MNIQLDVDSTLIKRFIAVLKLHIGMTKSWRTSWTSLGGTRMKHESPRCFVAQASGKTAPVAVEKGNQKKERFGEDFFLGGCIENILVLLIIYICIYIILLLYIYWDLSRNATVGLRIYVSQSRRSRHKLDSHQGMNDETPYTIF
jgi:hypothetical protein